MADILIIDDEPFIQELLSEMVERLGHRAYAAGTLQKGMTLLAHSLVDLVFLDINLPDGDGLEADEAGDGHKRPRLRGTS